MLLSCLLCAVSVSAFSPLALDQGPEHALLQKLTGKWVLQGKIGKKDTIHDVVAKWVLNQEYVQIQETSREKDANGKPEYDAIVYISWDPKKTQFACMWLDTTDVSSFTPVGIGRLEPDGKQIRFLFGGPEDGIETTFAFDERKDSWSWNIDNLQHGKKTPFARLVLTKSGR